MARKSKPTHVEAHCNKCGPGTWHELLKEAKIEGVDMAEEEFRYEFEFIQCQGCERVHMRERYLAPDVEQDWVYYPPMATRDRPDWAMRLWKNDAASALRIMGETYQAIHAGLNSLALMGARSLLDMALTAAVGEPKGGFTGKLRKAQADELISKRDVKLLATAFDAGSASAHRGYVPTAEVAGHVIDIVENVMQRVYILPEIEKQVLASTPPRAKSQASAGSAPSP